MSLSISEMVQRNPKAFQDWLKRPVDPVDVSTPVPPSTLRRPQPERHDPYESSRRILTVGILGLILMATRTPESPPSYYYLSDTPTITTQAQDYEYQLPRPAAFLRDHLASQIKSNLETENDEFHNSLTTVVTERVRIKIMGDIPTIVRDFPDKRFGKRVRNTSSENDDGYFYKVIKPSEETFVSGGFDILIATKDVATGDISVWVPRFDEETSSLEYFAIYDESDPIDPFLGTKLYREDKLISHSVRETHLRDLLRAATPSISVPYPPQEIVEPQLV